MTIEPMFAIMPAGKRANAKEETMEKIIGACGNDCGDCEAYKATQANDAGAIARVAEQWSNYERASTCRTAAMTLPSSGSADSSRSRE